MILLACDPKVDQPAFAVYRDGDPGEYSVFKLGARHVSLKHALPDLLSFFERYAAMDGGNVLLVVEDQYVGINRRTSLILNEARVRIETCALLAGVTVWDPIPPREWQSAILGAAGSKIKRAQRKDMARAYARGFHGEELDEDESDALCLLLYALERCGIFAVREQGERES